MFISSFHQLLSHSPHYLPHCQPALTPFLTQLCRHLSSNVLPLFLAFFLSFVSAVFMLLISYFLTQGTDFSNGPFTPPQCCHCHMHWSPCPCLVLPPMCPSPTCFSSRWLASLSGVWVGQISSFWLSCWKKMEIWIPCRVFSAYCLECFYQLDGSEHSAWQCSPSWAFG